jgi:uncharacterized protein with HEPN domain
MRPDSRKLLEDMREAADAIAAFVTGKSLSDLSSDALLRSGIYFQFIIIGEALSQLRTSDEETTERISEYWRIIGFRNQIVHGYARIDDEITWRIVQDKLPVLRSELKSLLSQ